VHCIPAEAKRRRGDTHLRRMGRFELDRGLPTETGTFVRHLQVVGGENMSGCRMLGGWERDYDTVICGYRAWSCAASATTLREGD
jgi:hypothetical protein